MNIRLSVEKKRILLVVLVVVFIVVIFSFKSNSKFVTEKNQKTGLIYNGTENIDQLILRDSDKDGVLDWEESLWGTDPTKSDSDGDGILDKEEISKEKTDSGQNIPENSTIEENLTQTDMFSRELFSTIATLNQAGTLDEETINRLGLSLAQQIENPVAKKVFSFGDIKTVNDDSVGAVQVYSGELDAIFAKSKIVFKNGYEGILYSIGTNFVDVLQKYIANNENPEVLSQLDPLINDLQLVINNMSKISVPQTLIVLHLNTLNSFEKIMENLKDLKQVEKDIILAMGGASKLEENINTLQNNINKLRTTLDYRLKK